MNALGCGVVLFMVLMVLGSPVAGEPLDVFVSIPPYAYMVERVGGEHVTVQVLVQPGQDPHTFEPTARQMMALGRAALYFKTGMPFERRLMEKMQSGHPRLMVVDAARGIEKRRRTAPGHGYAAESDPHIWLSPPLIRIQAVNIADALQRADSTHAEAYRCDLIAFLGDVDATHLRIQTALAPYQGQSFYVFHPAFGYFGAAYGLKQEAVEIEGKRPTPRQLGELVKKAKEDRVSIIFVQPQFASRSAEAVASAIGGVVVPMDPMAKDVLRNLERMAVEIERGLTK